MEVIEVVFAPKKDIAVDCLFFHAFHVSSYGINCSVTDNVIKALRQLPHTNGVFFCYPGDSDVIPYFHIVVYHFVLYFVSNSMLH
jgi:hypothetical protein